MGDFLNKNSHLADFIDNGTTKSTLIEIAESKNVSIDFDKNPTIAELADLLDVETPDLLLVMNEKNGTLPLFLSAHPELAPKATSKEKPDWIDKADIIDLDVRDDIAHGRDPFGAIMKAISGIGGNILHLINIFEPAPLYSVLERKGFDHYSEEKEGIWHIYFFNTGIKQQSPESGSIFKPHQEEWPNNHTIDVRGLEPPQPMVKIFEALETLPKGEVLTVHHFKRPKHLYPRLEEQGYVVETNQVSDDHIILKIHK